MQFSTAGKSPTGWWPLSLLIKGMHPYGGVHATMISGIMKDKAQYSSAAKAVAAWDFDRSEPSRYLLSFIPADWDWFAVIPCHGGKLYIVRSVMQDSF